jgi:hypothetical protein
MGLFCCTKYQNTVYIVLYCGLLYYIYQFNEYLEEDYMLAKVKYPYRRRNQRHNAVLEISLPNHKGKTNNVSTTGVSFEVIADDIDAFRPGTIIPLEITTINTTHGSKIKNLRLSGEGLIISREVAN